MQQQPRKALPKREPIADRFHVLKNVRERLKELMDRKHSCLPEVEEQASDAIEAVAQGIKDHSAESQAEPEKHYRTIPPYPYQRPAGMSYDAFQKQVRRDKRYARYEAARTLFEQGLSEPSDCTQTQAIAGDGRQICPGLCLS